MKKSIRKNLTFLLLFLLLTSCNLPWKTAASPTQTVTSSLPSQPTCYYNWATQPQPELSTQVQSAFKAAGLAGVRVEAQAYGENCIDPKTNLAVSFSAMETDFKITAQVSDPNQTEQMGILLEKMLVVLDGFYPESTPGPQAGLINVSFQNRSGSEQVNLSFSVQAGMEVRALGYYGSALFEKLEKK